VTYVFYLALAFGFYMAWSIGSNDAANAMGTSVGSKAITFTEAIVIAAVFEFSGAILAGANVTDTMRKGIIAPEAFEALGPDGPALFALGMLAALVSAAVWIHIAAFLGWPVSTTHSIVGSIAGFGMVAVGISEVNWGLLATIVASWGVSPVVGGVLAFLVFTAIRRLILNADEPVDAVKRWGPVLAFPVFLVLGLVLFFKGLKNAAWAQEFTLVTELSISAGIGVAASIGLAVLLQNIDLSSGKSALEEDRSGRTADTDVTEERARKYADVERVFRYLQTITACFVAFAHGSNDVANSIGPLAAVVSFFTIDGFSVSFDSGATIGGEVAVPVWVLVLGGVGIVVGLATYGRKVIETIGTKITEITPSRGFAAEFGAATTIVVGSKLGLPLSTTHTVVGSVIGVGFARGMDALNLSMIWDIFKSWVYTIPFTGGLTIILFYIFRAIFI
jgi:PiT family inorganic phosphate transporter